MNKSLPLCPQCGSDLKPVLYPSDSPLNFDQWSSIRSGDYFCEHCGKGMETSSGRKYFWAYELEPLSRAPEQAVPSDPYQAPMAGPPVPKDVPITEDWLRVVGFKWHQLERQPEKMWTLWLGGAMAGEGMFTSFEDVGIEVSSGRDGQWFCWFRSDSAHRYSRFIHIRHICFQREVIVLIMAITGQPWKPENHLYGSAHSQSSADYIRQEQQRIDQRWMRDGHKWREIEKDDTRGRALPEHYEAHEKAKQAGVLTDLNYQ